MVASTECWFIFDGNCALVNPYVRKCNPEKCLTHRIWQQCVKHRTVEISQLVSIKKSVRALLKKHRDALEQSDVSPEIISNFSSGIAGIELAIDELLKTIKTK